METLLTLLLLSLGINLAMFFVAYYFRTDKLTDISYAVTFVLLSLIGLTNTEVTNTSIVLTLMVCMWAFRLGSYLLQRIQRIGKDKRFDDKRDKFWSFLGFWLIQGVTVWIVMIPTLLYYSNPSKVVVTLTVVGFFVWFLGLLIETIADSQKYNFINDTKNKGKWIDIGLWKYSQHPNYFGEIVLWFGVYLFTFSGLTDMQRIFGLISPLYIYSLIVFVSGIPLLEKSGEAKWGTDENYQLYKKQTSVLFILPKLK